MAKPRNFLVVCKGNDARSQMAEGFARALATGTVNVYSAGEKPKGLNKHAVEVMAELGIDIARQSTHGVATFFLPAHDSQGRSVVSQ